MNGRVRVGLQLGTQPPMRVVRGYLMVARAMRLDSVMVIDHLQNRFPTALWDQDLTWLAKRKPTPHDHLDYQTLMGWASRVGRLQLGVGATDPIAGSRRRCRLSVSVWTPVRPSR